MRLGIQFNPLRPIPELLDSIRVAESSFDHVWMAEAGGISRHPWTLLTLVACHSKMGGGPCVAYPLGHNPLDMASLVATLGDFMGPEREVILGFGTGGTGARRLYEDDRILTRTREFIVAMKRLLRGDKFQAAEYPSLTQHPGFRPEAMLQLTFPLPRSADLILTGTGPKILRMAGEIGDGFLAASNFPTHSYAAFRLGTFPRVSNLSYLEEGLSTRDGSRFRRIYGINVSLARDGAAARVFARRQASIIVSQETDENLALIGIDVASLGTVREAYAQRLSHDEASKHLPLEVADSLIIAGTVEECVPRIQDLRDHALRAGFNEFYIGSPLGPNAVEAVKLLVDEVVPHVFGR